MLATQIFLEERDALKSEFHSLKYSKKRSKSQCYRLMMMRKEWDQKETIFWNYLFLVPGKQKFAETLGRERRLVRGEGELHFILVFEDEKDKVALMEHTTLNGVLPVEFERRRNTRNRNCHLNFLSL